MGKPLYRTPLKAELECDVIDGGTLRVYVNRMDLPLMIRQGERLCLRAEGNEIIIEPERSAP